MLFVVLIFLVHKSPCLNNEMSKKKRAGTYTTLEKYLEVYPEARNYQHIFQPLTYSVKPSSTTTPYRLCSNSSLQGSNGLSYNSQHVLYGKSSIIEFII